MYASQHALRFTCNSSDIPMPRYCPSHTRNAFEPASLRRITDWVSTLVQERQIDAIAACGHSGLLVAGAVSAKLGVHVMAVRKPDEHTVADYRKVSTWNDTDAPYDRWAFVDDCFSSGGTFLNVVTQVWKNRLAQSILPTHCIMYCNWEGLSDEEASMGGLCRFTIAHHRNITDEIREALDSIGWTIEYTGRDFSSTLPNECPKPCSFKVI